MRPSVPGRIFSALMLMVALVLGLTGVFLVPVYAVFMVVWMHAPIGAVLLTTLPAAAVFIALALGSVKLSGMRMLR